VDYAKQVFVYGPPVAVSNNGQIFIFKKPKSLVLCLFIMTLTGFVFVKSINVKQAIEQYLQELEDEGATPEKAAALNEAIAGEYAPLLSAAKSSVKVQLNDNMDVVVCLSQKENKGKGFLAKAKDQSKGTMQDKIKNLVKNKQGKVFYVQQGSVGFDPTDA